MMSFRRGDVVWVPFPHVETLRIRSRPALIISNRLVGPDESLCWAMMITNADRTAWPGDILIADHRSLGLPIRSKIRSAKIATLEAQSAVLLGTLAEDELELVEIQLERVLAMKDQRMAMENLPPTKG